MFFLAPALLVTGAEVVNLYSRAGVFLLFGGIVVWQVCSFYLSRSVKGAAISMALVTCALALFFLGGGATLERFQNGKFKNLLRGEDYRVLIQSDAFAMSMHAPFLGVGLGNFKPLFPIYRDKSVLQNTILHPESDWLWMGAEMGWIAVLFLAAAIALQIRRCFPFDPGSSPYLRSAALVCVAGFLIHGFVDVSGHRLGSLWPALFLGSIALRRNPDGGSTPAGLAWGQRLGGLVLILVGCWWLASARGARVLPTTATVDRLADRTADLVIGEDYAAAIRSADVSLAIAPLEPHLYFQRAAAESQVFISEEAARRDFNTARYLDPHSASSCFNEGVFWLAAGNEERTRDAWAESLRRCTAKPDPQSPALEFYRQMLARVPLRGAMRARVRMLARLAPDCLMYLFETADSVEFDIESLRLLSKDPELKTLSDAQKQKFFSLWFDKGDRVWLSESLLSHPAFERIGWQDLARCYASWGRFQEACETVLRDAPPSAVPQGVTGQSRQDLERAFFVNKGDLVSGLSLCREQEREGDIDGALFTLHAIQASKPPSYLRFVEGELWAKKKDWENAWNALERFVAS